MKRPWMKFAGLLLAAILAIPVAFADTNRNPAVPGALNYVEGQVSIGSEYLTAKSVGSTQLEPGQSLTTKDGKTEMLLTPGVFVRLDKNSSAQMVSSSLTRTEVAINEGEALVEVDEIHPQNDIRVQQNGAITQLLKTGLYDFDAAHNLIRVLDGKAEVQENDHHVTVKGGHELALNDAAKPKTQKFDKKTFEATDLFRFSSLRSDYLAEANVDAARVYYAGGVYGPGWIGAGWYWDPWFSAYTFIPGDGIFYNPFGWGFYSPLWAYRAPLFYGGRYYGRYYGAAPVRTANAPARFHNQAIHPSSGFRAGAPASSGRSSAGFSAGGGFHGDMGAMHGGFGGHR